MAAIRVLLMVMMCLVTDAPASPAAGVLAHLEDGEEIHVARRLVQRRPTTVASTPRPVVVPRITRVAMPPRPAPAPPVAERARTLLMPSSDPSGPAEDH